MSSRVVPPLNPFESSASMSVLIGNLDSARTSPVPKPNDLYSSCWFKTSGFALLLIGALVCLAFPLFTMPLALVVTLGVLSGFSLLVGLSITLFAFCKENPQTPPPQITPRVVVQAVLESPEGRSERLQAQAVFLRNLILPLATQLEKVTGEMEQIVNTPERGRTAR